MNRKFVYICSLYDYNNFIEREIVSRMTNVYSCSRPEDRLRGFILLLYKIHNSHRINNIIRLPFRSFWARTVLTYEVSKVLNSKDDICFMYSAGISYLEMGIITYLRKKYPNSKFVFNYMDLVSTYRKNYPVFFKKYVNDFDIHTTYNKRDSESYGLYLSPPRVIDYSTVIDNTNIQQSDIFFVGKGKDRLDKILNVYQKCTQNGFKCDFYIYGIPIENQKFSNSIKYNQHLPYLEALQHAKRAKCILNIVQDGAEGITIRDYEAIGMNKLLMTNNYSISETDFYTKEKIIFIDNIEDELEKLTNLRLDSKWNGLEKYSIENYFSWLEDTLDANKKEEIK